MTFTPGPWIVFTCEGVPHSLLPAGRPGAVVTFAAPLPSGADLALISVAPLLLEACEDLTSGSITQRNTGYVKALTALTRIREASGK